MSTTEDQLILSIAARRMRYTSPKAIYYRIDADDHLLLVVGDGPNGAYEWVLLSEGKVLSHSDAGYGSKAAAMRDGLIESMGLPRYGIEVVKVADQRQQAEAKRDADRAIALGNTFGSILDQAFGSKR